MTSLEFRSARTNSEVAAAYELAARVFGPSYFEARASKDRILRTEPVDDLRDVIVAVADGEVKGLVRIVSRTVSLGEARLSVGGVTSVAIHPDMRGQGCGQRIMEAALTRCRERHDALSIAFARRAVDGFYWRLGYVGLGGHSQLTFTRRPREESPDTSVIRGGFVPQWASHYVNAYDNTYRSETFRFVRTPDWFRSVAERCPWLKSDAVVTLIAEGSPIGYWVVDEGTVIEAASLPGHHDRLVAGLLGDRLDTLKVSPSHTLSRSLMARNSSATLRRAWDGGHLVRLLDRDVVMEAVTANLSDDERMVWRRASLDDHARSRDVLLAAAAQSLGQPPVWSKLDEF